MLELQCICVNTSSQSVKRVNYTKIFSRINWFTFCNWELNEQARRDSSHNKTELVCVSPRRAAMLITVWGIASPQLRLTLARVLMRNMGSVLAIVLVSQQRLSISQRDTAHFNSPVGKLSKLHFIHLFGGGVVLMVKNLGW